MICVMNIEINMFNVTINLCFAKCQIVYEVLLDFGLIVP
jgi:hypothetical protein